MGKGRQAKEVSEVIKFLCAYHPKDFFFPVPNLNIRVPGDVIQIKGYLKDRPKIMKAQTIIVQSDVEGIMRQVYQLASDPIDRSNIIQNRYIVATLERVK